MAFRTLIINSRVKLEYSLNYLVCRGEVEKRINLDEISTLIIQNISSAITTSLMYKLIEKNINVIFCDEKNNPVSQLLPLHSSFDSFSKIKKQISWCDNRKKLLWKYIIKEKIQNQINILKRYKKDNVEILKKYLVEVEDGDKTNREGHAAKVYFYSLFGAKFSRKNDDLVENKYLNYGYSIIVSLINRELCSFGYLPQIGIHHIGETNPFNLSYDFVEPLRSLVDFYALSEDINENNYKKIYISMLSYKVLYQEKECFLDNAIHLYVQNLLSFMNGVSFEEPFFIKYEP